MSYAAELIDATMKATGLSQVALAEQLGVAGPQVSKWRHRQKPIPEAHLKALLDLGGFTADQRTYYEAGIVRDTVTITSVRRVLDEALDRLRPTVAAVGLIVLGSVYALPARADLNEQRACTLCEVLRRLRAAFTRRREGLSHGLHGRLRPAAVLG